MTDDPTEPNAGAVPDNTVWHRNGRPERSAIMAGDLALSAFWVMFGVLMLIESRRIKFGSVVDPLGPRLVPQVIAGLLVVLGLAIVFDIYRRDRVTRASPSTTAEDDETVAEELTEVGPSSLKRGLVTIGLSLGYVVFLPVLGYILATFIGGLAIMLHLRRNENWVYLAVWSGVLTYGTFWIFTGVLNVQLPSTGVL